MPMNEEEITRLIKDALPDAVVELKDLRGDGDHFQAFVESREFIGKTRVQQHQMVYAALQGRVGGVLHALALNTSTPRQSAE
ncbi:MAG: BolA family transcriptional regulator [Alphaproteobacteria bacterium]|nr:BolA family transcriptional regulator [Alphaproteobacteria bacterium]